MASDADLITRTLLYDDRHAFATLVRRYQSNVRNMLRQLTEGDHALADDLSQEVFIRAYKSLAKFRGDAGLMTWLHRIAYNVFISDRRSQRYTSRVEEIDAVEAKQSNTARNINLQHDLEKAMSVLTHGERMAIIYCCKNGYSHREAAEILQQPIGTVKTHILRGKEKLRDQLAEWREGVA